MRVVLELAGVRNCFGKQLGSANPLNNARATIEGLRALRTFKQVASRTCLRLPLLFIRGLKSRCTVLILL